MHHSASMSWLLTTFSYSFDIILTFSGHQKTKALIAVVHHAFLSHSTQICSTCQACQWGRKVWYNIVTCWQLVHWKIITFWTFLLQWLGVLGIRHCGYWVFKFMKFVGKISKFMTVFRGLTAPFWGHLRITCISLWPWISSVSCFPEAAVVLLNCYRLAEDSDGRMLQCCSIQDVSTPGCQTWQLGW